jgi:hypothetical protein
MLAWGLDSAKQGGPSSGVCAGQGTIQHISAHRALGAFLDKGSQVQILSARPMDLRETAGQRAEVPPRTYHSRGHFNVLLHVSHGLPRSGNGWPPGRAALVTCRDRSKPS